MSEVEHTTVVLYPSDFNLIEFLEPQDVKQLMLCVRDYVNARVEPDGSNKLIQLAFSQMKPHLDRDDLKFRQKSEINTLSIQKRWAKNRNDMVEVEKIEKMMEKAKLIHAQGMLLSTAVNARIRTNTGESNRIASHTNSTETGSETGSGIGSGIESGTGSGTGSGGLGGSNKPDLEEFLDFWMKHIVDDRFAGEKAYARFEKAGWAGMNEDWKQFVIKGCLGLQGKEN